MSGVVAYLNQLIEKGERATEGPWDTELAGDFGGMGDWELYGRDSHGDFSKYIGRTEIAELGADQAGRNARFIAAADPRVVAALARVALEALALHERVEMDESVGICLSDRVPSLRLGDAFAELSRVVDQQSRT